LLAFAPVDGKLHRVTVRSVKGLVPMEQSLDAVCAFGNLGELPLRISESVPVKSNRDAGPKSIDIHAENLLRRRSLVHLEARFSGAVD
jgi:hypothetical protein